MGFIDKPVNMFGISMELPLVLPQWLCMVVLQGTSMDPLMITLGMQPIAKSPSAAQGGVKSPWHIHHSLYC